MAIVGTSNPDRTISLQAAVLSCINKYLHVIIDYICWLVTLAYEQLPDDDT